MVILDKIRLPSKKVMYIIGISTLVFIIMFSALIFKKVTDDRTSEMRRKQIIEKELRDKNTYNNTISRIVKSPNLSSMRELYNDLFKDKLFFRIAGWNQDESHCNLNVCNVRYLREKGRLFEYITLTKNDISYVPTFNEDELTYEGVVYSIDMESNIKYESDMSTIIKCTEFISKTYEFKSLLYNASGTEIVIEMPGTLFSFQKPYPWATYSGLKEGQITFSTNNVFNIDILQEEFTSDLINFKTLNLKNKKIDLTFSYYCF